jgi:hypothetical protein
MTNDPGRYNTSDRDKNSNSGAWIAAAVVAVLAVFGIWYFGKMSSPLPSPNSATSTTQKSPPAAAPEPVPAPAPEPAPAAAPEPAPAPSTGN